MNPNEFRQHIEPLKPEPPAWHRRPTGPGWWVVDRGHGSLVISRFQERDLNSIADYVACVYGPIPEPPEELK